MDRTPLPDDENDLRDFAPSTDEKADYLSLRQAPWRGGVDVFEQNIPSIIPGEQNTRPNAGFAGSLRRKSKERISDEIFEQIAVERSEIAFAELYERLSPGVFGFLFRFLRSEDDALDILQDAFAELWNKAPILYNIHTNLAAWCLHLARNLAISHLRSKHHKYKGFSEPFEPGRHDDLFPDEQTPEQRFTNSETKDELRKALEKLEPEQRQTIELVFFGGMSRSTAAEKLHMPPRQFERMILDSLSELEHALNPLVGPRDAPKRPVSKAKIARQEKAERAAALQKFLLGQPLGDR